MLSLPALLIFRRLPGAAAHTGSDQGSLLAEKDENFPRFLWTAARNRPSFRTRLAIISPAIIGSFQVSEDEARKEKNDHRFPAFLFFFTSQCLTDAGLCVASLPAGAVASDNVIAGGRRRYLSTAANSTSILYRFLSSCRKRTLATCWSSTLSSARRACTRARLRPWWTAPQLRPSWWFEVRRPSVTLSRV